MKILWNCLCCFSLSLLLSLPARAQQQITISWSSKQLQSPPITVDKTTHVRVTVSGVNDILYNYTGSISAQPMQFPQDTLALGVGLAGVDPCDEADKEMKAIDLALASNEFNPKPAGATAPHSIGLEAMRLSYAQKITPQISLLTANRDSCSSRPEVKVLAKQYLDADDKMQRAFKADHIFSFETDLAPLNNYTITITEKYGSDITDACKDASSKPAGCQIAYNPTTTLLTTSGGFLFSELPSRTYERRNIPGATDAVLVVNNSGPVRSILTAFVNVKIPCPASHFPCPKSDDWGWAFSIGPALQVGANSTGTSRVGLFTGVSLHAWNYLYLTPGVHIGEFADFPAGFSHNGQAIPSTFTGKLDPVTRTTVRFGISVTFKGFKIPTGQSSSQGTVKNAASGS